MAFLAPLFLAGLAAIALPVLLHLRRNRPKLTVPFSSLMFLEASPPITKRRSRLQDIVLLTLRCLALALLILAFARPFLPAKDEAAGTSDGSVMHYIVIDTSASMRGTPLGKAIILADELIDEIPEDDLIAIGTFSDRLRPLLSPDRARELSGGARKASARSMLAETKADWNATRLDASLLAAAAAAGEDGPLKVHVIGDFQKGSVFDLLRGETWPDQLQIISYPIASEKNWTNAGVRMLPIEKQVQRARVINSEGSAKSDFTLTWSGTSEEINISVPPGESAVFEAPPDLPAEGHVTLSGDDFTFDNQAAWATPILPVARAWYPDPAEFADTSEAAYFLNRAMQPTPDYSVEIVSDLPSEAPALTITSGLLDKQSAASLRSVIEAGGNALFTVRDVESARAMADILGVTAGDATEAKVADHARFGEIDFKSVVFAPFADARYSDFSGIRFWRHRILPAELVANGKVLARFDSGDPAWLTYQLGKGTLHVLTTTWRPADSQLALASKFPPLLHALLGFSDGQHGLHLVGDTVSLPADTATIVTPDGTTWEAPFAPDAPGLYQAGSSKFAVQLDPSESELTPLPEAELRALGLPLDPPAATAERIAAAAALSNAEQESRQRIGWWLLAAAAVFFLAETAWAAFAGRRPTPVTS